MLGYIHTCMEDRVIKERGVIAYKEMLKKAGFDEETEWNIKQTYPDELTFRLFKALAWLYKFGVEDAFETFGMWMLDYSLSKKQWDSLLRSLADNLHDFLDNLSPMHYFIDQVAFQNELRGPSFRCEPNSDGSLKLHYYSERKAMFPMVKGLLRQAAHRLFDLDIEIVVIDRTQEKKANMLTEHIVFNVHADVPLVKQMNPSLLALGKRPNFAKRLISMADLCAMYPCHMCFTKQLILEHCGKFLYTEFNLKTKRMVKISDFLVLVAPEDLTLSFKNIMNYLNVPFIFRAKYNIKRNEKQNHKPLMIKGQMMLVNNGEYMLFMGSPHFATVQELADSNMFISDFPIHDSTRDLIMLNQTRLSQQELNRKLQEQSASLKALSQELEARKKHTNRIMYDRLPAIIVDQLRKNDHIEPKEYSETSCLQCDLPYFEIIMTKLTPAELLQLMNEVFTSYERLIELHGCMKVLSFLDSYFVVSGIPIPTSDHVDRILNLALGMVHDARRIKVPHVEQPVLLRVGVHSGSVVGGIMGITNIRYCVLSETVNISKRLSQYGAPGKILVTNAAKTIASKSKSNKFVFQPNSYFQVGGNQATLTFFLERNVSKTIEDLTGHKEGELTTSGHLSLKDKKTDISTSEKRNSEVVQIWHGLQREEEISLGKSTKQGWRQYGWGGTFENSMDSGISRSSVFSNVCSIL